jgi:O-antigen/teichoic acid export membrane protein
VTPVSTEPQTAAQAEITPAPPVTAPSTAGMTTKVVKGSLWTLAGQVAPLAVSLITTPFVIRMLGAESYGVLILLGVIPNYLLFADLGMSMASTKFGSQAHIEGNPAKESRIIRTAAFIVLCCSIPIAVGLFVFSPAIVRVFNVPDNLAADAGLGLKFTAIMFVTNFLNSVFNTPQLARLRMDLNASITGGIRILGLIATPFVVYLGGGISGATAVLMVASLLTLLVHFNVSTRLLPQLRGMSIDREMVRPMLKYGIALAVGGIAAVLLANLDRGVLPRMVSVQALAYYSVAFTLAGMLTMAANAMIQSLIPAFSQLQSDGDHSKFQALYSRGVRLILVWMIPAIVTLALIAKTFFTIWAGDDFAQHSVPIFQVLLVGLVFNVPAYIPYAAFLAAGRTDLFAKICFAELIPYIVLLVALTYYFGPIGAAAAWSIRMIGDSILLFGFARRSLGVSLSITHVYGFLLGALVLLLPLVANFYFGDLLIAPLMVLMSALVIYSVVLWKLVLETEEILWITGRLSRYLA